MVSITHNGENCLRLNTILSAAQKRFALYGVDKTTMREIAEDLNISKGALYYYFSDKEHLIKAVVEKEQDEFMVLFQSKIEMMDNPEEILVEYIKVRSEHFRSLLNLSRFRLNDFWALKPIMESTWHTFHAKEVEIIESIFLLGIKKKIFRMENTKEVAELFLDLLKGMRHSQLKHKELLLLDQNEYEVLLHNTYLFLKIFTNGLKYRDSK
jgi:AcrR family transcriptional regulator